jgi:hypothetical protein
MHTQKQKKKQETHNVNINAHELVVGQHVKMK